MIRKSLFSIAVLLMLVPAFAFEDVIQNFKEQSSIMNNQEADYLWFGAGFTSSNASVTDDQTTSATLSGILALTAEYEKMIEEDLGIGAHIKYNSTADTVKSSGSSRQNTLIAGSFLRFHWPRKSWDFFLSPGISLMNVNLKTGAAGSQSSGLGFAYSFSVGVAYAYRDFVFGIENAKTYGLGTRVNGIASDDILFKIRVLL